MTNKQVKALRAAADDAVAGMGVPTCSSCAHLNKSRHCGATGYYANTARKFEDECGNLARFWTPKPPSLFARMLKKAGLI